MATRRLFLPTVPITFFVLLFGLSAYLGMMTTYDPTLLGDSPQAVLVSIGFYLAAAYLIQARSAARFITASLMILCAGLALLFVGQFRYQEYPEMAALIQAFGNATTFLPDLALGYLHPNGVATVLEAALPLAIAFIFVRRSAVRAAGAVTALLLLYAIFLTYSRGAYIGLAGAGFAWGAALFLKRLPRLVTWAAGIALALIAIAGLVALYNLNPAQPLPILNRPVDPRLTLYHNSLYLGQDYGFTGIGLGNTFGKVYSRYSLLIQPFFVSYPSNLLLSVWLNQGLLGLVAFVGIVAAFYGYVVHVIRRARPDVVFHGLWLGVTSTLIHGLFDARQYTESPWVLPVLFIGLGLTVAYGQLALCEADVGLSIRHWIRGTFRYAAAVVVLLAVLFLIFRAPITAAWYTNQGALDETRGDFAPDLSDAERRSLTDAAANWYRSALAIDPDYAPANRRLGNLLVAQEAFAEGVPFLERAYANEPTNPAAIKGLGLAYVWVGRTAEAAQLLKRLPNVNDMANELYNWGTYRGGDEQRKPLLAAFAWETAEYMGDAGNLDIWMQIGDFYQQASAFDRARVAYQHIIDVDPNHEAAREALAALDAS